MPLGFAAGAMPHAAALLAAAAAAAVTSSPFFAIIAYAIRYFSPLIFATPFSLSPLRHAAISLLLTPRHYAAMPLLLTRYTLFC